MSKKKLNDSWSDSNFAQIRAVGRCRDHSTTSLKLSDTAPGLFPTNPCNPPLLGVQPPGLKSSEGRVGPPPDSRIKNPPSTRSWRMLSRSCFLTC